MNWKKLLTVGVIGSFLQPFSDYVNAGGHLAFNTHNILLPAASGLVTILIGLFTHPPTTDKTAVGQSDKTFPGPATK